MTSLAPRILIAGMPASLSAWLAQALDATVEVAFAADEALSMAALGGWGLLVVDGRLAESGADDLIRRLRETPATAEVPILLAVDPPDGVTPDRLAWLEHAPVERVLLHPVDRGELARQAGDLLRRPLREAPARAASPLNAQLDAIWARFLPQIEERVVVVERALEAAARGDLDDALRRQGAAEAHKLTGILGTLGAAEGSRLARGAEQALEAGVAEAADLHGTAAGLRAVIAARAVGSSAQAAAPRQPGSTLVVVGVTEAWGRDFVRAATARGVPARYAASVAEAAPGEPPRAVLVELTGGGEEQVAELAARLPGIPMAVMAGRDSLLDRVRAVHLGARFFLQKPLTPDAALEALLRALPRPVTEQAQVLAMDDDPQILLALETLLRPDGVRVHGETEPLRFWATLQRVQPELVVLDVDMPRLNGVELCRVVRADAEWGRLPIVFLTARTDRDTLMRVFAAGADDYLTKPIVGPELSVRIRARLERARTR